MTIRFILLASMLAFLVGMACGCMNTAITSGGPIAPKSCFSKATHRLAPGVVTNDFWVIEAGSTMRGWWEIRKVLLETGRYSVTVLHEDNERGYNALIHVE